MAKDATTVGTALAWVVEDDVWGAQPSPNGAEKGELVRSDIGREVAWLERHGEFVPGGGYRPGPQMLASPLVWLGGLYTAAKLQSGHQWTVAAILEAGLRWGEVKAVDSVTGEPVTTAWHPDTGEEIDGEDAAYSDAFPTVVHFSYAQFVGQIDDVVAPGTQQNWLNTHQRFPDDPESKMYRGKDDWRRAKFSHFQELRGRDLPYDLIDACLKRAGLPKAQNGMSVGDVRAAVYDWREARDAGLVEDDEVGDTLPADTLSYTKSQKLYGKVLARFLVAECSLPAETADAVAYAGIYWMYHRADDALLMGAKANVEEHQLW